MSLIISEINYSNFRVYENLNISINSPLVIFYGPNACGKTNIIEGLQLLTYGDSFKKPNIDELILWGKENASIHTELVDGKRDIKHSLILDKNKRIYKVNNKNKTKKAFRENCSSVIFIPDNLQMIKASSKTRREALDSLGVLLSKNYENIKKEYSQTLKQKNLLLKDEITFGPLFDSWNDNLIINGASLCLSRIKLFKRLKKHFLNIFKELSSEEIEIVYFLSWLRFDNDGKQIIDPTETFSIKYPKDLNLIKNELSNSLKLLYKTEISRKTSLVGPHKDDILFFINGHNARLFASQGQQRTIVLAWKLAEMLTIQEYKNQKPILLLDDVMSELDKKHQQDLIEYLICAAQTFITTTTLENFPDELLKKAQIINVQNLRSMNW